MPLIGPTGSINLKPPTSSVGTPTLGAPIGGATETPQRTNLPSEFSPLTAFGNLSKQLGGGQYNIGQTSGALIKSPRELGFFERAALRGPLTSNEVQIDHIIPLSLGGTNDSANLQLLKLQDHAQKTQVDAIANILYWNKAINLAQARNLSKNWNNNPGRLLEGVNISSLPDTVDYAGEIFNIKEAIRSLPDTTKVSLGKEIKQGGLAGFLNKALNIVEGIVSAPVAGALSGVKNFNATQYLKDVFAGKEGVFSHPTFKEGFKHFISGATFGFAKAEPGPEITSKDATTRLEAKIGAGVGDIAGFLTSYGLTSKGVSTLLGAREATGITGQLLSRAANSSGLSRIAPWFDTTSVGKALNASPLAKNIFTNAGLFGLHGQLSKQEANDLETRAKRLITDIGTGVFFGGFQWLTNAKYPAVIQGKFSGKNITAGTLANVWAGYAISTLQGADTEDALINGGIFGALHGFGIYEGRTGLKLQKQAQESARNFFKEYGIDRPIKTPKDADLALNELRNKINIEIQEGRMSTDGSYSGAATPILQRALVATRQIYYENLSIRERFAKELGDMASVFQDAAGKRTVKLDEQFKPHTDVPNFVREFDQQITNFRTDPARLRLSPTQENQPLTINPIATKEILSTGMGRDTNSIANSNQKELLKMAEGYRGEFIDLVINPENIDLYLARNPVKKSNITDPNAIQLLAKGPDNILRHVGYIPTEENIARQNTRGAEIGLPPFRTEANKDNISNIMKNLGLNVVRGKIKSLGIGERSNEPYIVFNVPGQLWNEAVALKRATNQQPPIVPFANRADFFRNVQPGFSKLTSEEILGSLENNVRRNNFDGFVKDINQYGNIITESQGSLIRNDFQNLTYGDVMEILRTAVRDGRTSELGKNVINAIEVTFSRAAEVHGREMFARFWQSKIAGDFMNVPPNRRLSNFGDITLQTVGKNTTETSETGYKLSPKATPQEFINIAQIAPTEKDIFINQAIAKGKTEIQPNDYREFNNNGRLNAIAKKVDNKIIELIENGTKRTDPKIQKLYDFQKLITRDGLRKAALTKPDFKAFVNSFIIKTKELDIEPFDPRKGEIKSKDAYYDQYDYVQLQEFKQRYLVLRNSTLEDKLILNRITSQNGQGGILAVEESRGDLYEPTSYLQERIESYKKENNFSDLEIRRIDNKISNWLQDSPEAGNILKEAGAALHRKGYIAIADQNADPKNLLAIKIANEKKDGGLEYTKTFNKMVDRFEKNPELYQPSQEMIDNMASYLGRKELTPEDKFLQVFWTDLVGLGKDVSAPEITNRINLINDRSLRYDTDGQIRIYFLTGTKLSELKDLAFKNTNIKSEEFWDRTAQDGKRYTTSETMNQIRYDLGFSSEGNRIKGTTIVPLPDGKIGLEKGDTITMNQVDQAQFEKALGIKLKKDEIVSFFDNIKIGESKLKTLPDNPDVKYADVPKRNMRFEYRKPIENQEGTFSISMLGNFSTADGINSSLVDIFRPQFEKFRKVQEEILTNPSKTKVVLEREYGRDLANEAYGKLKNMWANGADIVSLSRDYHNIMQKIFHEQVVRNKDLRSSYVVISPDQGYYDGKTLKFLQPDEIMISRELFHEMKLNPSADGNVYVLTNRFPITKKTAMSKLKVLIGDNYGIKNLGKEHVLFNLLDTYARKEGDFDGDHVMLYALISAEEQKRLIKEGKSLDGIPEVVANNIELTRKLEIAASSDQSEFAITGVESKKYPTLPAFQDGLMYIMTRAADAKQKLGAISQHKNLAPMLVDNQATFKINNQVYIPKFDRNVQNKLAELLQASVDATKSPRFSEMTTADQNALSHIFGTREADNLRALSQSIDKYMSGLRLLNRNYPDQETLFSEIDTFNSTAPANPELWHPMQELFKILDNLQPIVETPKLQTLFPEITKPDKGVSVETKLFNRVRIESDNYAREEFVKEFEEPTPTVKSEKFLKFLEQQRLKGISDSVNRKNYEQDVRDYYLAHTHQYSIEDKNAISWHLIADRNTNWRFNEQFWERNLEQGGFVERFDEFFTPEQATIYWRARQDWFDVNVLGIKKDPTGGSEITNSVLSNIKKWKETFEGPAGKSYKIFKMPNNKMWIEQNKSKYGSRWAKLARDGHQIAWEWRIDPKTNRKEYTGRVLIDGKFYSREEAIAEFFNKT